MNSKIDLVPILYSKEEKNYYTEKKYCNMSCFVIAIRWLMSRVQGFSMAMLYITSYDQLLLMFWSTFDSLKKYASFITKIVVITTKANTSLPDEIVFVI